MAADALDNVIVVIARDSVLLPDTVGLLAGVYATADVFMILTGQSMDKVSEGKVSAYTSRQGRAGSRPSMGHCSPCIFSYP